MLAGPDVSRMNEAELAFYSAQFPSGDRPVARWDGDALDEDYGAAGTDDLAALQAHNHDGVSRGLITAGYQISMRTIVDFGALLVEYQRRCARKWGPARSDPKTWPALNVYDCTIKECDLRASQVTARVMFLGCRFLEGVRFVGSQCLGQVAFNSCHFAGDSVFYKREFLAPFEALGCAFREARFRESHFHCSAEFRNCVFRGHADFAGAQFLAGAHFGSTPGTGADERFTGCKFEGNVSFDDAAFAGDVSFKDAHFAQPLDLAPANLSRVSTIDVHGLRIGGRSVPMGDLRIRLDQFTRRQEGFWGTRVGLVRGEDGRRVHPKGGYGNIERAQQHMTRDAFLYASDQYSTLAGNFAASTEPGSWQAADFCHSRHFDLRRRAAFLGRDWFAWLKGTLFRVLLGNGVYVRGPAISALMVIVVCSALFASVLARDVRLGGGVQARDHVVFPFFPMLALMHERTHDGNGSLADSESTLERLVTATYFSAVTFTTIGYGDWHPVGWARVVAAFEGLLGLIFVASFTVILVRKIIR